jgi:hypothetical protein
MSKYSWEADVLPLVDEWSGKRWKHDPDHDDKRCDARSVAWEFSQAYPTAPPKSVAYYAIRRVDGGRQFRESARSITGPNPLRRAKPQRADFDPFSLFRTGNDPARIVCFRDLYQVWLERLNSRQRTVAELLATGNTAVETAAVCGLTEGRISQIRRELEKRWAELGT